jgi:serine O-acetyltransferase
MMGGWRRASCMASVTLLLLTCFTIHAWVPSSHSKSRKFAQRVWENGNLLGLTSIPVSSAATGQAVAPLFSKKYDLGLGKNKPRGDEDEHDGAAMNVTSASANWNAPVPVEKPPSAATPRSLDHVVKTKRVKNQKATPRSLDQLVKTKRVKNQRPVTTKKLVSRTEETRKLRGAVWDEEHYQASLEQRDNGHEEVEDVSWASDSNVITPPSLLYPDIDLSIPPTVYSNETDAVWELLRYEAYREAQREPLLVSFLYSTILNHDSLESALAFHLANRLSSPAMISTQIQSLIMEALEHSPEFRKSLRADVMAVRDRDPACTCLPDAFLYFKGFHALQNHRMYCI